MNRKILQLLQYILFLGIGVFLVWWQLKSMQPTEKEDFIRSLKNVDYRMVIPVVIMSLLSHLSRAMRWKILLEPLHYFPKLKNVFAVTMIGYLANAAVPRLGELMKCTFLARYEKLKVDKLFGSIILERTFDFVCFLLFIGITVLIQLDTVGAYFNDKISAIAGGNASFSWLNALLFLLTAAALLLFIRLILLRFPGNRFVQKVKGFIKGIIQGFAAIAQLKQQKAFVAHTLFIWAMYLLQVYVGFNAMQSTSHLGMPAACSVLTLATLAMIATPGGIGSFPIFVMQTLAIYLIPETQGKAFGWLLWGVNTGIVIVSGVLAIILLPYINKKNNRIITTE
ncbi:MAG TPA: lysylphosphatidylglycerol synthase transmembrane domain-containing protein [Ferruginibacter sp.]|nr:lysylphosphatidylglycerol synthase transmembrane domain-containing protein [Ferruginibacter sp.]HRO18017.1 lysylphosphatidylglycerol synthase transmembrane domain-containing protein [Ferruginibacter sp.]HRQ20957.1 lysylphosphatidylglycerol synthase transmembrane domain-containing protein [Ferruginibacter sp.]